MAKIPFNVKFRPQIESGEYKVETRDGKKVRVLCYDANNVVPVVALVTFNDGSEGSRDYYLDGSMCIDSENPLDLFIVTPEEELTEFEKAIKEMMRGYVKMPDEVIKETSAKLLDLARKQLVVEQFTSDPRKTDLYKLGKAEALKDLPRWKKCQLDDSIACVYNCAKKEDSLLYYNGHTLRLIDLEKLPGFKEDEK